MLLTCFAVEGGKLTKGRRWRLLLPNKARERSMFRTDGKSRDDVVAAGKYVAAARRKKNLYGWVSAAAQVVSAQGLEIVCDPIKDAQLSCMHYNVLGWPVKQADQSHIAQEIADTVCVEDLAEPIPVV